MFRVGLVTALFIASQLGKPAEDRPDLWHLAAVGLALGLFAVYGLPRLWPRGNVRKPRCGVQRGAEQALLVHIPAAVDGLAVPLEAIESRLSNAITATGVGEFDGNLVGADDATLYMYGPDADRLCAVVEPILRAARLPAGTLIVKQYGEPGAREERIEL